ncbi:MAG: hypothetical protein ABI222_15495 [Opitutaceae bacterium]
MNSDFTKGKVTPARPFGGVLPQQGRVQLDGDFNEQTEILRRYIIAHPEAQDTAEGISRGWLPQTGTPVNPAGVAAALEGLVAQGVLAKETQPDGQTRYRRRRPP